MSLTSAQAAIKEATYELVRLSGGEHGCERRCHNGGIPLKHSIFGYYAAIGRPDYFIRADVMVALEQSIGQQVVTPILADLVGCDLRQRRPPEEIPAAQVATARLLRMMKEIGELSSVTLRASADGYLSAEEISALLSEIGDVLNEGRAWRDSLHAIVAARSRGERA